MYFNVNLTYNYNFYLIILVWTRTKMDTLEEYCSTIELRELNSLVISSLPGVNSYGRELSQ